MVLLFIKFKNIIKSKFEILKNEKICLNNNHDFLHIRKNQNDLRKKI